jgi:hypothetical protein
LQILENRTLRNPENQIKISGFWESLFDFLVSWILFKENQAAAAEAVSS